MAMPKLILKSVMWGVDKVPEHWFEKIPGGYYSPKDENPRRRDQNRNDSSRDKKGGGSSGSSSRRHSTDSDTRGRRHDERRRQDCASGRNEYRRADRSYDGSADERRSRRDDDSGKDRKRERRRTADPGTRRRSFDKDEIYAAPRGSRDDNYRQSYQPRGPDLRSPSLPSQAAPPPNFAQKRMSMQEQRPDSRGSVASSYVPYAHIYGSPPPNNGSWPPPPPAYQAAPLVTSPYSETQQQIIPPVVPPPSNYRQNPYAQQPPPTASAGANPNYSTADTPRYAMGSPNLYDSRRSSARYDGANGSQARSSSQADRRTSRYKPSYNNASEFIPPTMVPPSQLPNQHHPRKDQYNAAPPTSNGDSKGKSRVREAVDTSQRGLGYSAIGAVTGGLLGSEMRKGSSVLPIAIGATMGALGANAFQGHDRRREAREYDQYERSDRRDRKPTHDGYYSD